MTSESIQYRTPSTSTSTSTTSFDPSDQVRRDRWSHIADMVGLPLTDDQLDELRHLSDRDAAGRYFPQLLDVEIHELLWAANVDDEVHCACHAAA